MIIPHLEKVETFAATIDQIVNRTVEMLIAAAVVAVEALVVGKEIVGS